MTGAAAVAGRTGPAQRRRTMRRAGLAPGHECAMEIVENANAVIERHRATNVALGYHGDSVVNPVADIGAMIGGFRLARIRPVRPAVAAAPAMEAVVGVLVRDNLALNIITLIHPVDAADRWQAGS
jgi:Protein of unknown function (DUF2585)